MIVIALLAFAGVGVAAGILGGLLGISGGIVTVPCLFLIFKLMGMEQAQVMHLAIGTSLAAMIINAISSTLSHHKKGSVAWNIFKGMAPGIVVGSILGALAADRMSGVILEIVFGVFLLLLSFYFFLPYREKLGDEKLPSKTGLSAFGGGVGFISNILGIGGGVMTVPLLMAHRVKAQKAIGTSAATGALISAIGTLSYLYFGLDEMPLGATLGFIYLPAFFVIGIAAFFTAPYGVHLAHRLSVKSLRRIFACALAATGLIMVFV